jgi:hypothetical protein
MRTKQRKPKAKFLKTFFILSSLFFQLPLYSQVMQSDSAAIPAKSTTAFIFGNLHGFGIGFDYRMNEILGLTGAVGVKSPVDIIVGPPFAANRINFTGGIKAYPFSWLYVDGGVYLGLYRLTEYLWITTPKVSIGVSYQRVDAEIGAAFSMPTTIYTQSRVSVDETIGAGEERITPAGPTFPFFRITYRAK